MLIMLMILIIKMMLMIKMIHITILMILPGSSQNDPPRPSEAGEGEKPKEKSVQNHRHVFPVLHYLYFPSMYFSCIFAYFNQSQSHYSNNQTSHQGISLYCHQVILMSLTKMPLIKMLIITFCSNHCACFTDQ